MTYGLGHGSSNDYITGWNSSAYLGLFGSKLDYVITFY